MLGRRESGEHAGYHELQTVFRLVDRADRVGIGLREDGASRSRASTARKTCTSRCLLKRLQETQKGQPTFFIWLEKVLPVQAVAWGAAPPTPQRFYLVLVNELWNLHLPLGTID